MEHPPAILIVEDDDALRASLDQTLARAGWKTLAAANAVEAMALSLTYAGPVPLAIVDVVMPGVGGLDVANQLRVDRPETRVLYISGYPASVAVQSVAAGTPTAVLLKPFSAGELLERVRALLAV